MSSRSPRAGDSTISSPSKAVAALRHPRAVRDRCHELLAVAEHDQLEHFTVDLSRLDTVADYVAAEVRRNYPDLDVPFHSRWRHFEVDGQDLAAPLLEPLERDERVRTAFDLAITSVLLDAGAGARWRYRDPAIGREFSRSEGLALASLALFREGGLSSSADHPWRADAEGLRGLTVDAVADVFQLDDDNPLAGIEGRVGLLQSLGEALAARPDLFSAGTSRPGNLYDTVVAGRNSVPLVELLVAILDGLGVIWPGRLTLDGVNLGDVWQHEAIVRDDATNALVPFHKLSQWLCYSLVEPLLAAGITVTGIDELTGLAEYRNGGLFIDLGVVEPRQASLAEQALAVDSGAIVEWRALTVALLDRVAPLVWQRLGLASAPPPLVVLLQGGTWSAGRRLAARREGGGPPIRVISDGTVF